MKISFPRPALCPAALVTLLVLPGASAAQDPGAGVDPPPRDGAVRMFLDCGRCDGSHIRREITFVNHVREADQAQVHVLVTDQPTGGGGRMFTLAFIGRQEFAGVDNTLQYHSIQGNTAAQERDGLTRVLALGLVAYAARTPVAQALTLRYAGDAPGATVAPPADPWRNWTFELYGGGSFNAETSQDSWSARYGFYANRVTEEWKIRLRPFFNHNARTIRRVDRDDIRIRQIRHGFESFVIRSAGPHWGIGVFGDYRTTTVDNLKHEVVITPAVEYSLFPYAEATRRSVTLTYRVGLEMVDYIEETIFEKTSETLGRHELEAAVRYRQPWGSVFSALTGAAYFHDLDLHRVTFNGNVSLRVGRGVSVNFGGNYQRVNDQLALPRGDASLEDILLQRRRLATSYRASGNLGLSYTFGSIFANVVNPRL